ncbi:ferric-dicitrate binding protein FerR, regulates iron transport through sigma-19 [Pedobacter steynii]|uniref:Ferric-dicitrate binding protein FerR, regulates iron transport through sigma-19 n=2 Tax=Pedobacter steynii TaxID=430522 RepID=A0A1H0L2Y3_9SPHI|nr:ferric-dicitrate binding protein FerR, regulates iron transport through sigma-19 [Pedobacter steynii]
MFRTKGVLFPHDSIRENRVIKNQMDRNELKRLAQKYLDGTASEEEKALLNQWYDTNEEGWVENVQTKKPETEDQVRARIFDNLKNKGFLKTEEEGENPVRSISMKKLILKITAAAAVLTLVFWGWQAGSSRFGAAEKKLVNVPGNKIIEIMLPDSSKVWLNAGSVFKYPKKFDEKNRTVELIEGRAFFEVKHKDKHPFIVKTNSLNVVVLGTSFDVRAYKKEGSTKVSVVTGKVGITMKDAVKKPAVMLLPKEQVVLTNIKNHLIKAVAPEIAVNAWCNSKLVFEQETLRNVFSVLEKKHHLKINTQNPALLDERISITLNDQNLAVTMDALSFTKHFKYHMADDNSIIIK